MVYKNQLLLSFLLVALITVLSGCADKKDSASSCLVQLDAEKYQTVAENTNCSNYHRASGYLGMAGMSFSNFMKKGASDNLTKTLTISNLDNASDYSKGTRNYITKALCLVGPDNLTTSSRCSTETKGKGRTGREEIELVSEREISFFGLLGDLIYLNYGMLDNDSNGTISTTESNNFTNLQSGFDSSGGGTTLNTSNHNWEIISSNNRYVLDNTTTKCHLFVDNYTTTPTVTCSSSVLSNISELRPIYKLDNMTDITGGGALDNVTTLVSELTSISNNLNTELSDIGLSDNSSLRTSLTNGMSKLDNGGFKSDGVTTCTAAAGLDVVYLLVKDAADNTTSATSSNLHDLNLINLTDLTSSVDSSATTSKPDAYSGKKMDKVRLIYATNTAKTTYSDSYEAAYPYLYNSVKNTRSLGTETSTKGDGKVILRELLCVGDN